MAGKNPPAAPKSEQSLKSSGHGGASKMKKSCAQPKQATNYEGITYAETFMILLILLVVWSITMFKIAVGIEKTTDRKTYGLCKK